MPTPCEQAKSAMARLQSLEQEFNRTLSEAD